VPGALGPFAPDAEEVAKPGSEEKEKKTRLLWLLPQRLIYRWLMLIVLFKAFLKAIKGELQGWGVLKRTGSIQTAKAPYQVALSK